MLQLMFKISKTFTTLSYTERQAQMQCHHICMQTLAPAHKHTLGLYLTSAVHFAGATTDKAVSQK